jgi:four helix bundle protein
MGGVAESAYLFMSRIQSFRDLDAWKTAMDLAVAVYPVSGRLPDSERFDLRRQINRSAASIPANVAEGQGNGPGRRYLNHVRIAQGSLAELETHLELCVRLKFLTAKDVTPLNEKLVRTGQLLHGLARSLRPRGDQA